MNSSTCSTYDRPELVFLTGATSSKLMPNIFSLLAAKNWQHLLTGVTTDLEPLPLPEAMQEHTAMDMSSINTEIVCIYS